MSAIARAHRRVRVRVRARLHLFRESHADGGGAEAGGIERGARLLDAQPTEVLREVEVDVRQPRHLPLPRHPPEHVVGLVGRAEVAPVFH